VNTKILPRYLGGKEKLAEHIVALFPKSASIYVEPFGGGASVLLHTAGMFAQRVYNDLDDDLVTLWRVIRDQPEQLAALVWATPFARVEMQYCVQPPDENMSDLERARRLICKFSQFAAAASTTPRNSFVVQKPSNHIKKWLKIPDTILYVAELFRDVVIEHTSAETLFPRYDSPDTVWYLDPPYVHATRRCATAKYNHELTEVDHFNLLNLATTLQGSVFVSGYHNDLYDTMLRNFRKKEFESRTRQNSKAIEVLWYKYSSSILTQQAMQL
jgi:DNA adenine methylase